MVIVLAWMECSMLLTLIPRLSICFQAVEQLQQTKDPEWLLRRELALILKFAQEQVPQREAVRSCLALPRHLTGRPCRRLGCCYQLAGSRLFRP
jgi:hypothetical protein